MRGRLTRSDIRIQRIISCAAVAAWLCGAAPVDAQTGSSRYRFTTVLDSLRDGLVATRCTAINTAGTVAVQVEDR